RGRDPGGFLPVLRVSGRLRPRRLPARPAVQARGPVRQERQARMKRQLLILLAATLLAALYPQVFPNYLAIPITMLLFIGWATSWDLIGGWAGQVSLGHVAFVGIGAYFVAVGAERFGVAPWWSLLAAMGFAAVFAMLWGGLTFRLQGPY